MSAFGLAFEISIGVTVAYTVISCVLDWLHDDGPAPSLIATVLVFLVSFIGTGIWFRMSSPALNYSNIAEMITVYLVLMLIVNLLKSAGVNDTDMAGSVANWVLGIGLVGWFVVMTIQLIANPWGQAEASHLASIAKVVMEQPGAYPDTDTDHISLVPKEAAAFEADQALTQASGKDTNVSTLYGVGPAAKQSINHHLYWVFPLKLAGTRTAKRTHYIVPGYIVVDAENPEASPQLKLGYKMRYSPGGRASHSIRRLIWSKYPEYTLDDLTFEVNDDGQPYYTATLDKPAYTFGPVIPSTSIVVDPQTGKISLYKLGHAPVWVDRVYSASAAKRLVNWWGEWGDKKNAPWKYWNPSTAGRFKVSSDPNLVYTKDKGGNYPEWQMLITSRRRDTAAIYVALFDARTAKVRMYRVQDLQTEKAVLSTFESTASNVKKFTPTEPALHKIYGRLTWVVGYINANNGEAAENQSLQAIGLLAADHAQGNNVQFGSSKTDVLTRYQLWLAGDQANNDNPDADSVKKTIEGTVLNVSSAVNNGDTNFYLVLDTDPTKLYRGQVGKDTVELPFVKQGAKVRITFLNVGESTINIVAYDDVGLKVGS